MVAATASYRGTATVSSARATANVATAASYQLRLFCASAVGASAAFAAVTIDACRFWSADAARVVWTSGAWSSSARSMAIVAAAAVRNLTARACTAIDCKQFP